MKKIFILISTVIASALILLNIGIDANAKTVHHASRTFKIFPKKYRGNWYINDSKHHDIKVSFSKYNYKNLLTEFNNGRLHSFKIGPNGKINIRQRNVIAAYYSHPVEHENWLSVGFDNVNLHDTYSSDDIWRVMHPKYKGKRIKVLAYMGGVHGYVSFYYPSKKMAYQMRKVTFGNYPKPFVIKHHSKRQSSSRNKVNSYQSAFDDFVSRTKGLNKKDVSYQPISKKNHKYYNIQIIMKHHKNSHFSQKVSVESNGEFMMNA
ncbi:hypothetical protein WR164_00470 [Philodulcilactobacillus myokoensis]|uniref:Uncharacterized protein n=1 Tax=Philodulcilactobacillus myokoensis TaxID=2929573 RepID=A0A9W6AZQ3_9LACO|nr:hypothetical protein [Philodulcilactobacillus myokoensis]GLB46068.1 hypothetical protein WR164_00470 [Philodulcilactobacillus myokoensis]